MALNSRAVAFIAVLSFACCGSTAFGCSWVTGTFFPSNYDLVREADAIVLVDSVSIDTTPPNGSFAFTAKLTVKTVEAIKGYFAGGTLDVPLPSSCYGYDFKSSVGQRIFLFLNKGQRDWYVSGTPLGELGGQLSGAGGPWETAVRHYARIAELNDYEKEKLALQNLQAAALRDSRSYPAGLDTDIERHFTRPYPAKSYSDLMELYTKGTIEQRNDVLWAFAHGKHKEARTLMQNLLRSSEFPTYTAPIAAYLNATEDASSIDALGAAYLGMKKQARWPIMHSLIQLARQEDMGLMLAVLKSADVEEAGRLAAWFVRHPGNEATQIIRELVGTQFDERWELSLSLSALGDKGVVAYVSETVAATQNVDRRRRTSFGENPALKRAMALEMLAKSPLPEATVLTREVISRGNIEDVGDLCEGLLNSINPNRWDLLRSISNLKAVDDARDHSISRAMEDLATAGDQDAKALLAQLKR